MTDCFALLNLPRQPWLDPELVQNRFNSLSALVHPDKFSTASTAEQERATARFAELNQAFQTLRDTKSRVGHLIQLESGAAPGVIEQVSNEFADLFFQVSSLCRQTDQFLAEKNTSTSPMLKAMHFTKALEWTERLQAVQETVQAKRSAIEAEARRLNEVWSGNVAAVDGKAKAEALERLRSIYASLGYFNRWNAQLQERIVQLAV